MTDNERLAADAAAPKSSLGWKIGIALGAVAAVGTIAAAWIPALAGAPVKTPTGPLGAIFWVGLLGFLIRRRQGKSGGIGWLIGGLAGLVIHLGASFYAGYQMAAAKNDADWQQVQNQVSEMNAQLPQMVNEELRFDRATFDDDGFRYYLTFPDYTLADIQADAGLEAVHEHYFEMYRSSICGAAEFEEFLAVGGAVHFESVDMNGEHAVSFRISQSDCE